MASRIQSLGVPGSILISKKVTDEIKNKTEFQTISIGSFEFKNVHEPIEVFALANQGFPVPKRSIMQGKLKSNFQKRNVLIAFSIILFVVSVLFAYKFFLAKNDMAEDVDKSIAVLPFENMSNDPEQEYFSNGITEDILNHLVKIADLRVKSRTSTLQYKGKQPSIIQVGEDLGVANIVEGSVRRVGDKVRIVVQLIDAKTDVHLWSETYDRDFSDILELQSEIAIKIANALEARLTATEKKNIQKEVSQDVTAYDYFLKARESFMLYLTNRDKMATENAMALINQALQLDSTFSRAYALKARIWFSMRRFGVRQKTWQDSSLYFSSKATSLDQSTPDGFLVQSDIHRYLGKLNESRSDIYNAFKIAPNDPDVLLSYGRQLLRDKDEKGAQFVLKSNENKYSLEDAEYYLALNDAYYYIGDVTTREKLLNKAKNLSPGSTIPYFELSSLYHDIGQYEKGIREMEQVEKINPANIPLISEQGWLHYLNNDLEKAAKYWSKYPEIEARFEDSTQTVPFRHRLGMAYIKMGRKKEADALFEEDLKILSEQLTGKRSIGTWNNHGGTYYGMAIGYAYLGNSAKAVQCLDSALHYEFYQDWLFHNDPLLSTLRNRDDFKKVLKKVDDFFEFRRRAYSNALNRMEASKELKNSLK